MDIFGLPFFPSGGRGLGLALVVLAEAAHLRDATHATETED